ncbi:unnamed protein product [Peniophora sp. CBMAI 1063]|nr:unnamed protein product [Peniophora sp. CBMAI 1063]
MARNSSAPALPPDGVSLLPDDEGVTQRLEHSIRGLSKLALEGKTSDVRVQQDDAEKSTSGASSISAAGSNRVQAWLQDALDESSLSVSSVEEDSAEEVAPTDDGEDSLPDPLVTDDALRCVECAWEIVDGICQGCGLKHKAYDVDDDPVFPDTYVMPLHVQTLARGDTPTLDVDLDNLVVPPEYVQREKMYQTLLSRGATREMCIQYKLRFYDELGIIAWANDDLFDEFTGDLMKEGDLWQICLGRHIKLDWNDPTGELFIFALLEEVIFWPTEGLGEWETVLTRQSRKRRRVWVTRPVVSAQDVLSDSESAPDSDEGSDVTVDVGMGAVSIPEYDLLAGPNVPLAALFLDEYASDSEDDDLEDDDSEDDSDDEVLSSSDLETDDALTMVQRDTAWNVDADHESSDDSDIDLLLDEYYN